MCIHRILHNIYPIHQDHDVQSYKTSTQKQSIHEYHILSASPYTKKLPNMSRERVLARSPSFMEYVLYLRFL